MSERLIFMSEAQPHPRAAGMFSAFGLLGLLVAMVVPAHAARAGDFAVTPTMVTLTPNRNSALLKIINQGDEDLRFRVDAVAWTQDEWGGMALTPTTDIRVYPATLSIAPGETGTLRVETLLGEGDVESSYRLLLSELPPADAKGLVQTVAHMSLAVFIPPLRVTRGGEVLSASLGFNALSVRVSNRGNVHTKVSSVRVVGRDADGSILYDESARGWYILPGGDLVFDYDVPSEIAPCIRSLAVRAMSDHGAWEKVFRYPVDACGM